MGVNEFIFRKLIKEKNFSREKVGYLEGWISIVGNLLLFAIKFSFGLILKSISLIAESFHSLSDILTSIIVIFGFKLSKKPPDEKHPFGHGRIEKIAGLIIAILLIFLGMNFGKEAFLRILHPKEIKFNLFITVFMFFSGFFKEWMARFSILLGKSINSDALIADGLHHRLDGYASFLVGIGFILMKFKIYYVDGIIGLIIVGFLIKLGIDIIRETSSFLIGEYPGEEIIQKINDMVFSVQGVLNVHDIKVHDYLNKKIISLHIEVDSNLSAKQAHEIALKVQDVLKESIKNSEISVHIDPQGERED